MIKHLIVIAIIVILFLVVFWTQINTSILPSSSEGFIGSHDTKQFPIGVANNANDAGVLMRDHDNFIKHSSTKYSRLQEQIENVSDDIYNQARSDKHLRDLIEKSEKLNKKTEAKLWNKCLIDKIKKIYEYILHNCIQSYLSIHLQTEPGGDSLKMKKVDKAHEFKYLYLGKILIPSDNPAAAPGAQSYSNGKLIVPSEGGLLTSNKIKIIKETYENLLGSNNKSILHLLFLIRLRLLTTDKKLGADLATNCCNNTTGECFTKIDEAIKKQGNYKKSQEEIQNIDYFFYLINGGKLTSELINPLTLPTQKTNLKQIKTLITSIKSDILYNR